MLYASNKILKRCMLVYFWRVFPKLGIGLFFVLVVFNCLFLYFLLGKQTQVPRVGDVNQVDLSIFPESYSAVLEKHFYRVGWQWRIKYHGIPDYSPVEDLNCTCQGYLRNVHFLGSGWTKSSYRVVINNGVFVLKTVNDKGHDVSKCTNENQMQWSSCFRVSYMDAGTKILNEIVRLKILKHPNVIKVIGYCAPDRPSINDRKSMISIITEYGEPVDVIKLLTMSWEERLRISLGLSRLLNFLSKSPLGTISLNDFRRQQFVLVSGEIKLIDVDDIGLEEPSCTVASCCIPSTKTRPIDVCVPCVNGYCKQYNEKLNILNAGRHFIDYILPHGAPTKFSPMIEQIVKAFKDASWTTAKILKEVEHLTDLYIKGMYRSIFPFSHLSGFKVIPQHDLPALYDYRCKLTVSGYGCSQSVFDEEEAAAICAADSDCKAFVFTNVFTWTGRKMVHFKNGAQGYVVNNSTTLYIKL